MVVSIWFIIRCFIRSSLLSWVEHRSLFPWKVDSHLDINDHGQWWLVENEAHEAQIEIDLVYCEVLPRKVWNVRKVTLMEEARLYCIPATYTCCQETYLVRQVKNHWCIPLGPRLKNNVLWTEWAKSARVQWYCLPSSQSIGTSRENMVQIINVGLLRAEPLPKAPSLLVTKWYPVEVISRRRIV